MAVKIDLSWTAATIVGSTIANYFLFRQVDSGSFSPLATVSGGTLTYSDLAVTAGHTYSYFVFARPVVGTDSANSNTITEPIPAATLNWTSRTSHAGNSLLTIASSGTSFVAADLSVPGDVVRSTDNGTTWTLIPNAGAPGLGAGIIGFGNSVYLIGCGGGHVRISVDDGVTWGNTTTQPFVSMGLAGVVFGSGIWLALGNGSGPNNYARSADNGVTWTRPATFTNSFWDNCAAIFDGTQFVAIAGQDGTSDPTINTSADGINWTETLLGGDPLLNKPVAFGNGVYMLGQASTNAVRVASTPAGLAAAIDIAVTFDPSTGDVGMNSVGFGVFNGTPTFVALGNQGGVAVSTDNGATWTAGTLNFTPPSNAARAVGFANNTFVAVGDSGDISTLP